MLVFCFTESVFVCVCVWVWVWVWVCVWMGVSVAWLAVCVCAVLRDAAGSCAWSGDVMMSCGFLVSLLSLFSAWSTCWQPFEMSIIFITTKTSKIGGFLWKKTCPRNDVACWKILYLLCFLVFSVFFHCVSLIMHIECCFLCWLLLLLIVLFFSFCPKKVVIKDSERYAEHITVCELSATRVSPSVLLKGGKADCLGLSTPIQPPSLLKTLSNHGLLYHTDLPSAWSIFSSLVFHSSNHDIWNPIDSGDYMPWLSIWGILKKSKCVSL